MKGQLTEARGASHDNEPSLASLPSVGKESHVPPAAAVLCDMLAAAVLILSADTYLRSKIDIQYIRLRARLVVDAVGSTTRTSTTLQVGNPDDAHTNTDPRIRPACNG